ncbi:MAG: beta-lactamase family protein [Dehalococcoidia bacterium]|nr:beta-lactamase family protein [Dehalococcoidia bacterium]
MTAIHGTVAPAFAAARAAFERCFAELGESGAAVCAYVDGEPVVDLWGGQAGSAASAEWREDTIVHTYSVTKAFAAVALLVLVDRGEVELDAPVARYWPEFAQAGKGTIPVRWLLSHQAGLLGLRAPQSLADSLDWDATCRALAAEAPWWEPGTRHGEHARYFGHLVGEVLRRVTGQSLGAFLRREVCEPWGLDFAIGLTGPEQARAAEVRGMDDAWRASIGVVPGSLKELALQNPPGALDAGVVNSPAWRAAEIPAINGHGTARGVARLYAGLAAGGELDGRRILSESLVREMTSIQCDGEDVLLGRRQAWGLGVQVDPDGFGMGGLGGALGWGNAEYGFTFGYVTRQMGSHDRAFAVFDEVAKVIGLPVVTDD